MGEQTTFTAEQIDEKLVELSCLLWIWEQKTGDGKPMPLTRRAALLVIDEIANMNRLTLPAGSGG